MLTTNRQRVAQLYECVKSFHCIETLSDELPNPQNENLLPILRPYQVKAVKWMLSKELHPSYYVKREDSSSESALLIAENAGVATLDSSVESCTTTPAPSAISPSAISPTVSHSEASQTTPLQSPTATDSDEVDSSPFLGFHIPNKSVILLPKGGILADEMGLGKTVEVLACILSNPRVMEETKLVHKQESEESKTDVKVILENREEIKIEKASILHSGSELDPTEDGTVEVHSGDVSLVEDLRYGVGNLNESSCSANLSSPQSGETKTVVQEEPVIDNKIKRSKQVIFDTSNNVGALEMEVDQENVVGSKRKKRRVKFNDCNVDEGRKRKRKSNITKRERSGTSVSSKDSDAEQPKPKRAAALKAGETFTLLKAWYDDCLSETSVKSHQRKQFQNSSSFQCCCMTNVESDDIIQCPNCKTWQHTECVGYNEISSDYDYNCFQCWKHLPLVPSAGTVIISPEAISQQWVSEIEKHIKKDNLKVLVYEGVRVNGYIQPHDLASYDVVITTYQVLTRELNYTESVVRNLRHAKRFFAPTSPLMFVEWWRMCLDEAQMVEGSNCRAAEMAKKFSAINKWAITGTPIQKAVNDLVGLMEFLAGNEYPEFLAHMTRDWLSLLMLVPRVLWRTQMKDVLKETGVPPQTVDTHFLHFSKIEKYFYQCTHAECSQQFLSRINKFPNLNVTVKSLDRKAISNLLNPLLKLRQACIHPQVVRKKFLSFKKTMTMNDLLTHMATNAKLSAEQALRQLVATLNGTGALHIIRQEWPEAVAAYRAVLHLVQEHQGRLKIDSLQKIHTMHNLAEVLNGDYEGVPSTLRDDTMTEDTKALELRYLDKRETPIFGTMERIDQHAKAITELLEGATLGYSEWWLRILEWSPDRDELLHRVKSAIQLTDVQQKNQYNNLANKLKSLYIVRVEVAKWLAELDRTREEVLKWITLLKTSDKDSMASEALICHLPTGAPVRGRTRCQLCKAESVLKNYEALVFEERSKEKRKNRKQNLPGSSDWTDDKDMDNKEVAELVGVNVNTFESSKKGGFKASPFEKILKALATYGRQKQVPCQWTKEASHHISILDRVKKEFLDLNLMWRQIFDLVDAKDELNMCKTRIRLPYPGEEQQLDKKKIGENHHIIALYKVEPELHKLKDEKVQYEALLKKKIGTLCYLENLQKEGTPSSICPICRNDLSEKWAVMQCGHCVCLDCLSIIRKPQSQNMRCPQCRELSSFDDISYVENQPSVSPSQEVKGTYSTKVNAVVSETLRLTSQQPDVKILVFSAWEKVLDLLAEAFEENSITFRRMQSGKLRQRRFMKEFKTGNVTVLLLPLRSGAKGLNLVEATHVFLVEPILNPAEELQAVGRVHRIGQTKPTVVHRFIVLETIEERILTSVVESRSDKWNDDCVTLKQLFDLFNTDFYVPPSQSEPDSVVVSDSESDTVDVDSDSEEEPTD